MTLIDRANRYIKADQHRGLFPLLSDCVAAGNNEGLLAVKLLRTWPRISFWRRNT